MLVPPKDFNLNDLEAFWAKSGKKKVKVEEDTRSKVIKKLDSVNRQYYIMNQDDTYSEPLNTFDNVNITLYFDRLHNDKTIVKYLFSGFLNAIFIMEKMEVVFIEQKPEHVG